MRFASLGSGSRGNGSVVASDSTTVLVDCGFNYKEAISRLKRLKVDPDSLSGILVSHEHSDHASGIEGLANRHNIPVYASRGTWIEIGHDICNYSHVISGLFSIGNIEIWPIPVPHDAREPLQFVFTHNRLLLGILSDLGSISGRVLQGFQELDALSVEFNHDRELLQSGPYPGFLKSRVGGDFGHLNNDQAASLVAQIVTDRLKTVVACHVSETNNEVVRVEEALERALRGRNIKRLVASQSDGFNWISVGK